MSEHATRSFTSSIDPHEAVAVEMSPEAGVVSPDATTAEHAVRPSDRKLFDDLIMAIPEEHRQPYYDRLSQHSANKHISEGRTAFYSMISELRLIHDLMKNGGEQLNFELGREIGRVSYVGYALTSDINAAPDTRARSRIDLDVPIERDGKAYVYETKSNFRDGYGADRHDRNQCLKYQAAIDSAKVSGASIRIKGILDPTFLAWANRNGNQKTIPDVELVYSLDLPSGASYSAQLKKGPENEEGIQYANPSPSRKDERVVRYIERAVKDDVYGDIISLVSERMAPSVQANTYIKRRERKREFTTALYKMLATYYEGRLSFKKGMK